MKCVHDDFQNNQNSLCIIFAAFTGEGGCLIDFFSSQ